MATPDVRLGNITRSSGAADLGLLDRLASVLHGDSTEVLAALRALSPSKREAFFEAVLVAVDGAAKDPPETESAKTPAHVALRLLERARRDLLPDLDRACSGEIKDSGRICDLACSLFDRIRELIREVEAGGIYVPPFVDTALKPQRSDLGQGPPALSRQILRNASVAMQSLVNRIDGASTRAAATAQPDEKTALYCLYTKGRALLPILESRDQTFISPRRLKELVGEVLEETHRVLPRDHSAKGQLVRALQLLRSDFMDPSPGQMATEIVSAISLIELEASSRKTQKRAQP